MIHSRFKGLDVDITLCGMVETNDGSELADSEHGREATFWDIIVQHAITDDSDRDPIIEFEDFKTVEQASAVVELLEQFFPQSHFEYV